jgi:hypothetical protein
MMFRQLNILIGQGYLEPIDTNLEKFLANGPVRYNLWKNIIPESDIFNFIGKNMKPRGRPGKSLEAVSLSYKRLISDSFTSGSKVIISNGSLKPTVRSFDLLEDAEKFMCDYLSEPCLHREGSFITFIMNGIVYNTTMFGFTIQNGKPVFNYIDNEIDMLMKISELNCYVGN